MKDREFDFYRYEDEAPVSAVAVFETSKFSESYEVGQRVIWRDFIEVEVLHVLYTVNFQKYSPTEDELKDWSKIIEMTLDWEAA